MKIINGKRGLKQFSGCVLTLGNFDGVHTGHKKVISNVIKKAEKINAPSVVFTFQPHPLKVIKPKSSPPLLLTPEDKASYIEELGIKVLVLARFTKELAATHPHEFIEELIVDTLDPKEVVVGHDFSFGRKKSGTIDNLKKLGNELGFKVTVIKACTKNKMIVSSSLIRELISTGEVHKAHALLGRSYSITGKVVRGMDLGKKIGYPTANISTKNEMIPPAGVYAVKVEILTGRKTKEFVGVTHIGAAPTFKRRRRFIETHILDFEGDLYGKVIRINFHKHLRNIERFESETELKGQIIKDIKKAGQNITLVSKNL